MFLSVVVLLTLCGCSGVGITDTYWRNDKTGEWLIGLTEDRVIYDCKVWDIAKMNESDGTYSIQAKNGLDSLDISFGSEQDDKRTITIGGKLFDCSIIDGRYLPDYPEKDTCARIADNHYQEGDSVTIAGWVKPKKSLFGGSENETNGKEVIAFFMANILTGEEPSFTVPIDQHGQFVLRIPIENTTSFCLRIGQETQEIAANIVAEPNETYFLMKDYDQGKTLFMGKNARLQNEVNAHRILTNTYGATKMNEIGDIMNFLDTIRNNTKTTLEKLEDVCREHPTLSERYRIFHQNYILAENAYFLMQGRYSQRNYELPEEYIKAVDEEYWQEFDEPYTMSAYEFSHFLSNYDDFVRMRAKAKMDNTMKAELELAEKEGLFKLSAKDREAIRQYEEAYPAYWEKRQNAPDSLKKVIEDEFGKNDFVKAILEIQARNPKYDDYSFQKFTMHITEQLKKEMDARNISETVQDIILSRHLYCYINWSHKSLGKEIIAFADEHIHIPASRNAVLTINHKYEEIANRTIDSNVLKSNDAVKGLTDGEKIFRKIIEPYKGKIILVDFWGTWCGPCKVQLSHSQEEYERLKDFDVVYLYLANHSPDAALKNVIKEYNVMGKNVAHYNLPAEQQKAVEEYFEVKGFPTNMVIDRDGSLHKVLDFPLDIDALAGLLKRMK